MPTILRESGFRFFFYAGDGDEPAHVHVEGAGGTAKFWLNPVFLARSAGFRSRDINEIQRIVEENRQALVDTWNAFFNFN